ncbi:uncharacterized protein A1O9_10554 [Exophiala aquamarina CBS 119918]|uniref:Amidohydrolase-related domain-containing protein n=1 Tax=Exophiala aquamarina CBS 119918 TaxID=1182545 RepID=A0A072P0C1_9EURO|nr:uncharacterized protein A1O9_10554 [Exophiala aquamarina CBS 119918]KEF53579.1 hypothetical protein A1O9_10554 [Exophiala aquamarina CBS 119918]
MSLTCKAFLLAVCIAFASAHPSGSNHSPYNGQIAGSNVAQQIFLGRFISTPTPDQLSIEKGAVLVSSADGKGFIEAVAWNVTDPAAAITALGATSGTTVVTADDDSFFFPGFIGIGPKDLDDGHIHAPQYPNLGLFAGTLLDWLQAYTFPMESSLDPFARAQAVYSHVIEKTLSYGTTSAAYYATVDVPATNLLADLAFAKGQRAYIGRTCMDNQQYNPEYFRDESPEDAINKTLATIQHIQGIDPSGELVAPIITPRFAPAVTNESMTLLGNLARQMNLRIQTHIDENVGEVKLVAEMYPEQSTYAGVYDAHGLLTNRTILGHGIHMTDTEIALVAARGAGVAHCPTSNSALGSGICHVRKLIDAGVKVGLGTDAAGGYSANILEVVRQAFLVSRLLSFQEGQNSSLSVPVAESLYLGTMGGARLTGMEGRLGGFAPGMLWDVQEIKLGDWEYEAVDIFGWENWHDRVNKWVWNGDDRNVNRVWVGGRLVHQK